MKGTLISTIDIMMMISSEKQFHTCIDGLVQERRNTIANALELRLSCTNLLIYPVL